MATFEELSLDETERRVRGLVLVPCEVRTETGASLVIFQGRFIPLPRSEVFEINRNSVREDGFHDGSVVIPKTLAVGEGLQFRQ